MAFAERFGKRLSWAVTCVVIGVLLGGSEGALAGCFEAAGARFGISAALLKSIAAHESGLNPMAIARNDNGTEDMGLMQINSVHLPRLLEYGIDRSHLFDACLNVHVGAWVLAQNIHRYGNTWEAVGAYNVGCAKFGSEECTLRRKKYVAAIQRSLARFSPQTVY